MDAPALKIRRGQRQDFDAIMRLLAPTAGTACDRRTLRRFRHIVADLGADLYVAEIGGRVVGVVHASYARQLGGGQRGRIEDLAADPELDAAEIERQLLDLILARARKRDCATLSCAPANGDTGATAERAGLRPRGTVYSRALHEA